MHTRLFILLLLFFFREGIAQQKNLIGKKFTLSMQMKTRMENVDPMAPSVSDFTSMMVTVNTITGADDKEVSMDTYIKRLAGSKTIGQTLQSYDSDDGATLYHPALKDYLSFLNKSAVLLFREDKILQKGIPLLDKMQTFSGNTGIYDEYLALILTKLPVDGKAGFQWSQKTKHDDIRREANYTVTKMTDTGIEVSGLIDVSGNRTVNSNGIKSKIRLQGTIQMTASYDPASFLLKNARYQTESKIRNEIDGGITNYISHSSRTYSVIME